MPPTLDWLLYSAKGTLTRIAVGVAILALFAIFDIRKNGIKNSRRIREYAFLASYTLIALLYGALNDYVTSHISWQYYYYGKGLSDTLTYPPNLQKLQIKAILIGMKSSWTPGLIAGAAILIVNNPSKKRNSLPFKYLYKQFPRLFLPPLLISPILGLLGFRLLLAPIMPDSKVLFENKHLFNPKAFICVWGIHLGAYLGGLISILWVCLKIHFAKQSRQQIDEIPQTPL